MHTSCCKCLKEIGDEESWYGLHKNCFKHWFSLPKASLFLDLIARSQSQAPQEKQEVNISFFNGAYRKYSARLGESSFILKVQQQEYPELPATEFLCNQIYESLNISIPSYYLIRFPEDQLCFVTKNFISELNASDLIHIYHCLGFIQSAKGLDLAPFYDNPSALALESHSMLEADLQPRGSIFTQETDKPTMKDYVQEWVRLGYGDVVARFRKQHSLEKLRHLIEKSYLSEKRQKALLRLVFKRSEELCEV